MYLFMLDNIVDGTSLHSREILPYSMSSLHHCAILAPSTHDGEAVLQMISLDDNKEHVVPTKKTKKQQQQGTCVVKNSLEFVSLPFIPCLFDCSPSTCYS